MAPYDLQQHSVRALTADEHLRVSWFRAHPLGAEDGPQTWVMETLTAMTDDPLAVDLFDFDGTFSEEGREVATRLVTDAGFRPACTWHLTHDGRTWALSSLRPVG